MITTAAKYVTAAGSRASTDPALLDAYTAILEELDRRDPDRDGAIGRDAATTVAEVMPTFYYALAVDALVAPGSV